MNARTLRAASLGLLLATAAAPVAAQRTVGVGLEFMGYTFDDGLGAQAAQLFMMPVAARLPIGTTAVVDLYTSWAEGRVESDGVQYVLNGPVDTRAKFSYQFRPWALASLTASLPTGNATHDGQEALVASFLSADLLGFREATWGAGFGITPSLATAVRVGEWGVGAAGAYSLRGGFEPFEVPAGETPDVYRPGNEVRVRVGVDRNVGTNTFTGGLTVMNFSEDQRNERNFFQAGLRARLDANYLFRAGAGVWTVYLADVIRQNGDLTIPVLDSLDVEVGQELLETPSQNLLAAGFVGTVAVGGSYIFRPLMELRLQTREDADGSDQGSGWIMAAGGDFPIRLFGVDFFPKARALYGSIKDGTGASRSLLGMEFSGTLRVPY